MNQKLLNCNGENGWKHSRFCKIGDEIMPYWAVMKTVTIGIILLNMLI